MWAHKRDLTVDEVMEAVSNFDAVVDYWHDLDDNALLLRLWSARAVATPGEEWPVGTLAVRLHGEQWSLVERVIDAEEEKAEREVREMFRRAGKLHPSFDQKKLEHGS